MKDFDLTSSPLEGTHCISASAGTGKTFTISHLFLRLLLEKKMPVESILVVTFTEAATEELKERIRRLILEAISVLNNNAFDDSPVSSIVSANCRKYSIEFTKELLYTALHSFDQSAIHTIHSFCLRILKDNAFESGMRFDTELIKNQDMLLIETVQDFWRLSFYNESRLFLSWLLNQNWSPQRFYNIARNNVTPLDLKIIPEKQMVETIKEEKSFIESYKKVSHTWDIMKKEISGILLSTNSLHKKKYKKENIPVYLNALDTFLSLGYAKTGLFKNFNKFTSTEIEKSTNKGQPHPKHVFFDYCTELFEKALSLQSLFEQKLLSYKFDLFLYLRKHLHIKKQDSNVLSFDDLLINLYTALLQNTGPRLISSVRNKFHAALIDEFQDTDSMQYSIFKFLFSDISTPLFLIGDPKQAIYSFRGADIFTFLKAADNTPVYNQYTLRTNFRSEKNLIHALNTLFTNTKFPFIFNDIPYFPIDNPVKSTTELLITTDDGCPLPPLDIWFFSSELFSNKKESKQVHNPIKKEIATELICGAVSNRVVNLLLHGIITDSSIDSTSRPIAPDDIAILVRTRDQARLMHETLTSANIPAVLYNADNIFDTIDALEINHILHAVAFPYRHGYIKTALCTALMGIDGDTFYELMRNDELVNKYYEEFRELHEQWIKYGFMFMFSAFIRKYRIRKKILSVPDGERHLTNVLHIQDILQEFSTNNHVTHVQVVNWFSSQINPDSPRLEEHELRLDKDDKSVKILTIHRSKGLEFPVVFCPFTWGSSHIRDREFVFHSGSGQRVYELGSNEYEKNKIQAEKELLAENIRLFYVAVTRAKYCCYLAWGRINNTESSAPAYLFHKPETWNDSSDVTDLENHLKTLNDSQMVGSLLCLSNKSGGAIHVTEYKDTGKLSSLSSYDIPHRQFEAKKMRTTIPSCSFLTSFSSLIKKQTAVAEFPDYEEIFSSDGSSNNEDIPLNNESNSEIRLIETFPRGNVTGTFFHEILENLDFTEKDPGVKKNLILEKLKKYGFESSWMETVYNTINNVISLRLISDTDGFYLSSIPRMDTSREMEFYYPVNSLSPQLLKPVFRNFLNKSMDYSLPEKIESLEFHPTSGFMHGYIDCLIKFKDRYYLIDWKSNFLGETKEDYAPENLRRPMIANYYFLQYYIYTLAVDKYLNSRLSEYSYEKHFGGVFYIFLRGISFSNVNKSYGVYFDKPDASVIRYLSDELIMRI